MLSCPVVHGSFDSGGLFRRWDVVTDGVPGLGAAGGVVVPATTVAEAAALAWRHSARCVGRLHWKSLQAVDAEAAASCDDMFEALCGHLRLATNGGRIRPVMTVFRRWLAGEDEVRIWNHQLVRYAGYDLGGGQVLGDPANVELTSVARRLGWCPPTEPGRFDLLPLVLQYGSDLRWYPLPAECVLEVPLRHPRYPWVEKLSLRWHAVPVISDMMLATGTAAHPCAPFNGWYMGTEIGSRNLGDEARYNQLPVIAEGLGLDIRQTRNLWRDHALLVLNEAVLYSFEADGVRLVDHHQATAEFEQFCQLEKQRGREVSADWSWIVPPMAGSSTPAFHRHFPLLPELPNLLLQVPPWATARGRALLAAAS